MQFRHIDRASRTPISGRDEAVLIDDAWDDYTFQTLFDLVVFTDDGSQINLGGVKILSRGMESGRVKIPRVFDTLGDNYCSIGLDENYYETLAGLPKRLGEKVLRALRDCVQDPNIHQSFQNETGFRKSLMRSLSDRSVTVVFSAALGGQAPLTPFHFTYAFPPRTDGSSPPTATFEVVAGFPEGPPENALR